ncbi:hypothetical protein EVAR_51178_1 [Eumeta japonica]|uniref:Mariner Mos1 transposase n=1 Tax=Eumeta variegata TaxID=151549 RepID=A0A4C1XB47_EUMVA|nr:hypothetical protein EVAR_51178_1 [Eumeta japonica]
MRNGLDNRDTRLNIYPAPTRHQFKSGRVNISNKFRDGRPSTAVNNKSIDAVRRMIETHRDVTYHKNRASLGTGTGHVATVALKNCRTVNSDWYTISCLPEVIDELRKNNRKRRIILHRDNTSSHNTKQKVHLLSETHPLRYSSTFSRFSTTNRIRNDLSADRTARAQAAASTAAANLGGYFFYLPSRRIARVPLASRAPIPGSAIDEPFLTFYW